MNTQQDTNRAFIDSITRSATDARDIIEAQEAKIAALMALVAKIERRCKAAIDIPETYTPDGLAIEIEYDIWCALGGEGATG